MSIFEPILHADYQQLDCQGTRVLRRPMPFLFSDGRQFLALPGSELAVHVWDIEQRPTVATVAIQANGFGLFFEMTGPELRAQAAKLIASADEIEGRS